MTTWTTKDPQAVEDYSYTIPLDAGDAVATHALTVLAGTVAIDSESLNGNVLTAWLSGGAEGETAVFRIAWTTVGGRSDDDVIMLFVSSHEFAALVLAGYAKPLPTHLKMRYPAFSAVDAATIQYWLTDAERSVDTSWGEGDYAAALMALAAHNMTLAGLGADAAAIASVPIGITQMRSGSLGLSFTNEAANARMTGDFTATRYGQEYQLLLRRNRGGPSVTDSGVPVDYLYTPGFGYGGPGGPW